MVANRWRILHIINIGTFMSTLDVGIVNVALPTMAEQFGVSLASIQWVVTCYLLTMVALLPLMGRLSDAVGRHYIYSGGFLVFAVGSLYAAFAGSLTGIIIARCIQGVGATMIMANSQAMVRQIFPDEERGRALGFNAVVISIGTLSGPALGGLLLGVTGWEWLFLLNVPFGIAGLVFGLKWFPKIKQAVTARLDLVGSFLLAIAAVLLMLASEGSGGMFDLSWLIAGGLGLLLLFAVYEIRIKDGILDRELFTKRLIVIGNVSAFAIHLIQMASLIPITFYFQHQLGFSPWLTGLVLCVQPLLMGIAAPYGGTYRDRYGAFVPLFAGPLAAALSMAIVVFAPSGSAIAMTLQLGLFGIAMGLFQSTNNAEIMSAAPDHKISHMGSMLALIRYMGMIAGTGLAAAFVGDLGGVGSPAFLNGVDVHTRMQWLFAVCLILSLAVSGLAMLRPRRRVQEKQLQA